MNRIKDWWLERKANRAASQVASRAVGQGAWQAAGGEAGWRASCREAREWLERYPPYEAPFPTRVQTLEQAQANLEYLLAHRSQRLQHLSDFLAGFGVDVAGGSAAPDVQPLMLDLHRWTRREFPKVHDPRIAHREVWLASNRKGKEIVFSLLMDLALLCGELVVTRRPAYSWSLDLDPDNGRDGMATFMRPVVQLPKGDPFPAPIIFDFEAIVVGEYLRLTQYLKVGATLFHIAQSSAIDQQVVQAIRGDYEAAWLRPR
jgi:hypothetical protein